MNNCKSILIVDDSREHCLILKDIFEDIGYSVDIACSKIDASLLLENSFYKIALIDLRLEQSDGGINVIKRIKEKYPGTKLFVMTGYQQEKEIEEALSSGVLKMFIKPFDMEVMIQTFEQLN